MIAQKSVHLIGRPESLSMAFTLGPKFLLLWAIFVSLAQAKKNEFDPYVDNKGTIVGVAGEDYVVIAADTRLPDGFFIRSRTIKRLFELEGEAPLVLATAGCWSDSTALVKVLNSEVRRYEWENRIPMSVNALAHLLASTLFSRRTFPYYTFCAVAGFDKDGLGALYRYDAVGSFERLRSVCVGNGEAFLQPILDDALERAASKGVESSSSVKSRLDRLWCVSEDGEHFVVQGSGAEAQAVSPGGNVPDDLVVPVDREQAVQIVVDVFKAAAEREISIGDGINIWVIDRPSEKGRSRVPRLPTPTSFVSLPPH